MKKKFVVLALAGLTALSLTACGSSSKEALTVEEEYEELLEIKARLDAEDESAELEEEAHEELEEELIEEELEEEEEE